MNGTKSLSSLAQNSGNSTEAEYAKFLEKLDMNINVFVGTLSKWFQNECRKAAKSGNAKFSCNVQVYNAHIFEVIVTNVRITEVPSRGDELPVFETAPRLKMKYHWSHIQEQTAAVIESLLRHIDQKFPAVEIQLLGPPPSYEPDSIYLTVCWDKESQEPLTGINY